VVNSNAFADIDGDCLADLLVVTPDVNGTPTVEIYINDKTSTPLTFTEPFLSLPSLTGMGQLTLADFG